MSHPRPVDRSPEPVTVDSLAEDLRALGVEAGQTLLVHGSLSSLGWVCGGAPAVVDALQAVVGESGTIVMPTMTPWNVNPAEWDHPPVPESWYEPIRQQMPAFRPQVTPASGMGAIAECFRSYPGVLRSDYPKVSFAAWGAVAEAVVAEHLLEYPFGEGSPLARVYELDGDLLFLGKSHATNTSLHLAEYRVDEARDTVTNTSVTLVDGDREWVQWEDIPISDEDFPRCGAAFERERPGAVERGTVGVGDAALLSQPALVDFACEWFARNRTW
jgi:aminoglycoside 3-N-acetyltransferase